MSIPPAQDAPPVGRTASPNRVLVVDDEAAIRAFVAAALEELECEVLLAADGVAALQLAREARPQVVLLDVRMPNMNGLSVCRALRAHPATSSATVIFLTALASPSDLQQASEAGADDFLLKPFTPDALRDIVRAALARGRRPSHGGST